MRPPLPENQYSELLELWLSEMGLPATLALCERFGGTRISVPAGEVATPFMQHLGEVLGAKALRWFLSTHGRERLMVPKASHWLRTRRDAQIRARHEQGESANRLAAEYHLHLRQVRRILAAETTAAPQLALFP